MLSNNYVSAFVSLGKWIERELMPNEELLLEAYYHNRFFTIDNIRYALRTIVDNYLNEHKLIHWLGRYHFSYNIPPKRVGIVMAGNIPLVGFHDLLCVLISGNIAVIKMSSRDKKLLPEITKYLIHLMPSIEKQIEYADMLKVVDAIIATGSNNSYHYFEYYFGKYPHIIRKNRNSVAILRGDETTQELQKLGEDVFRYFGLGCRNVSMLLVPAGYDFTHLSEAWKPYQALMNEEVYKNNFDYHYTIMLMNKIPHISTGFVLFRESDQLASPIGCVHYKTYTHIDGAIDFIEQHHQQIQCVVASPVLGNHISFGMSQQPELWDYADGIDTMEFLGQLLMLNRDA